MALSPYTKRKVLDLYFYVFFIILFLNFDPSRGQRIFDIFSWQWERVFIQRNLIQARCFRNDFLRRFDAKMLVGFETCSIPDREHPVSSNGCKRKCAPLGQWQLERQYNFIISTLIRLSERDASLSFSHWTRPRAHTIDIHETATYH